MLRYDLQVQHAPFPTPHAAHHAAPSFFAPARHRAEGFRPPDSCQLGRSGGALREAEPPWRGPIRATEAHQCLHAARSCCLRRPPPAALCSAANLRKNRNPTPIQYGKLRRAGQPGRRLTPPMCRPHRRVTASAADPRIAAGLGATAIVLASGCAPDATELVKASAVGVSSTPSAARVNSDPRTPLS